MKINSKSSTAGGAIIVVLLVLVVAIALVGSAAYYSSSQNRMAARQREVLESVAVSDGTLEYAYAVWRDIIRDAGMDAPSTKKLKDDQRIKDLKASNNSTKSPAVELASAGNTLSDFTIASTDPWGQLPAGSILEDLDEDEDEGGGNDEPVSYKVAVDDFPGWQGQANFYKASVTATGPKTLAGKTNVKANVARYFSITRVPLFQAAIFYMDDLEIHPGALMTIDGLVHTNKNLYAAGYDKLQFLDNVSYVGTFTEGAPTTGDWSGYGTGDAPTMKPFWSDDLQTGASTAKDQQLSGPVTRIEPFGKSPQTLFSTTDSNQNNDGFHEWVEPPVSGGGNSDPVEIADQRLYNKANLRIEIDSSLPVNDSNRIKVRGFNGASVGSSQTNAVKAAIDAGTTMYDWREGGGVAGASSGNVKVTSVDVRKLNTALSAMGLNKPVVHVRDVASTKDAIRLKNGSHLTMDLTFASDNPIYVQGDYNTGTGTPGDPNVAHNPSLVPANNGGNTDGKESPVVSGYVKKSAAIIADAVTVLSNNWNDANATKTLSGRLATHTTVNAAFMAGDVPTGSGSASGGAHNFPRFLEAWYDFNTKKYIDLTYHGSMVQAFQSKTFTGKWSTGNVYVWPNRKWAYEKLFSTAPPPGSVMGTTFSRGRWERL